ncbi:phage major capsid protein [Miltoncostaea oceani]|uniref:phage major capsid protein n=1 Tax=Miltoncostaea oceani TaxID=2843216 RepID=UPI001C3E20AE|nr:phage major capsid protein [Miltoncostaea oceani]
MPQLVAEDIAGWSRDRLESAYGERLDRVRSIRDGAGGSLVNVKGAEADEVRNLMADTNMLGARIDEVKSLAGADAMLEAAERRAHDLRSRGQDVKPFPIDSGPGDDAAGVGADGQPSDIGGRFLASDAWQSFRAEGTKGIASSVPLASLWKGYRGVGEPGAALFDSADFPSQADWRPGPVETLYQPNNIAPLMPQGTTGAATVRYPKETVTSRGAATVAEGGTKPEAELSFTAVDEPIRKIAVLLPLTDESLEDEAFLRSYINARLGLFVRMEEDRQLLDGNGGATPPQIIGLLRRSGINTATSYSLAGANPDQALIDGVFKAAMRVRESFLAPDSFVLRAATWEIMRLAKDANRQYLLGPPAEQGEVRLWGLRGVLNENMPAVAAANKPVLVGAFGTAAMVIRRSGIELAVSDSHSTFFAENKVMLRAEERLGMAVFRPQGFSTVTSAA